jgi:hypothetical protein
VHPDEECEQYHARYSTAAAGVFLSHAMAGALAQTTEIFGAEMWGRDRVAGVLRPLPRE